MVENTAVCYVCHDDYYFLEASIRSFQAVRPELPVTVFVSTVGWDNSTGAPEHCIEAAERAGVEVITGAWSTESEQRSFALETMKQRGVKWLFTPDGDEIVQKKLLETLLALAKTDAFDLYRVRMWTFWKTIRHRITPPEELAPILLINAQTARHLNIREYSGERPVTLGFEHGCLMHLSYVGSNERILKKISSWSHKDELVKDWFENVWLAWDTDRTLRNLHPTHPGCYGFAERIPAPEELRGIDDGRPVLREPELPKNWLNISVVIPVYGGPIDLLHCLESLDLCGVMGTKRAAKRGAKKGNTPETRVPLLHEVIVVDDSSPEDVSEIVKRFPFVKFLPNKENLGFGASCNRGFEASTGDAVLFLNSDTRVPRASLIRMGQSLLASGTVGAVGPLTNNAGYNHMISPTLTDLKNLERFACDFADRDVPDTDESMVVGFCLLVRRSVLEELGAFDLRYGRALYEDTDLVQRILRTGYKTRICRKAYVHHEGSKSLARMGEHPSIALARNKQIFLDRWHLDVETGFMPHLAGMGGGPITLNPEREPKKVIERLRKIAHQQGISVCMIVRDEERVIGNALDSLLDVFPQVIVLDTGSVDRTMEIAREKGAEVHQATWKDSFSAARNESICYAKGRWIFWIDADDTVPFATLEAVILAALNADPKVNGFVVPVQFVEGVPGAGTRVDHVKLFRNDPRHQFEGRIHENILHSLRATGGELGWINQPVLHSGYDRSPEGQRNKRKRDRKLLALDLKDRQGHPFPLFNLGMTEYYCGKFRASIGWFKRCLKRSEAGDSHVRKVYVLYGSALLGLGRTDAAIEMFERGLAVVGEDPELRYNLALILSEIGRFAEARAHLLAMNPDTSGFFASLDIGILGFKRFNLLGSVCMAMGLHGEAKDHLREAIRSNPAFAGSALALFEAAMKTGDIVAAREASNAVMNAQGPSEHWASTRIGIAELIGMEANDDLRRLAQEMPQAMGPGLMLARRLLERGVVDIPLLSHLEMLGNAEACHHLASVERSRGNLEGARYHAGLAVQLDPGNLAFGEQLVEIELALDDLIPLPEYTGGQGAEVLIGPHVGCLGPASLDHSVVVVTFNSGRLVRECLTRVLHSLGDSDEIIVVDNASADDTARIVSEVAGTDHRVMFLPQVSNLGYSKACNVGILASRGAKIVALNPDAYVEDCWLERLSEKLTGDVAAVGPVSDMITGKQFVGNFLGGRRPDFEQLAAIMAKEQPDEVEETKLLMGVCLMMRRDLLDKHGLLCEETRLGADDLEYSFRMSQLSYRLLVVPGVFVHHVGGASFATLPKVETRILIRRSDRALLRRLKAYYGDKPIPSSQEIWGSDIFAQAMATAPWP
jgi:GT2 family glycosyltransferase/tetratricopeptide (TPR) repeat protein